MRCLIWVAKMPPARKMRFSRNKGTHEERATSLPTGASSAAASSSTGNKRGRVPRPSSQAAPLGSRSMMQRALDSSAAKSLADQRASLAASRRERAARRAASPDGMNTPPPMASRNPSSEMSSGGSQPLAKRQGVHDGAPSFLQGFLEEGGAWRQLLAASGSAAVIESADKMDDSTSEEASVVEAAGGLLGMAQVAGSVLKPAKDAAATVAAIPTTDKTTRTLSRTAPGALDEQQVDRPASAVAAAGALALHRA